MFLVKKCKRVDLKDVCVDLNDDLVDELGWVRTHARGSDPWCTNDAVNVQIHRSVQLHVLRYTKSNFF